VYFHHLHPSVFFLSLLSHWSRPESPLYTFTLNEISPSEIKDQMYIPFQY
jgi:hypothetical protein